MVCATVIDGVVASASGVAPANVATTSNASHGADPNRLRCTRALHLNCFVEPSLEKLRKDLSAFYEQALKREKTDE